MRIELAEQLYTKLERSLKAPRILKKLSISKDYMERLFQSSGLETAIESIQEHVILDAKTALGLCKNILSEISEEPNGGWLDYISRALSYRLFPESFPKTESDEYKKGMIIYLEIFRTLTEWEKQQNGFNPSLYFEIPEENVWKQCDSAAEYKQFLTFRDDYYLFEYMRLKSEITPYNTLAHIAGVHHLAMYIANQLKEAGVKIDIALMSAAAISHDLGKYGCRESEQGRVAYLHYFYTERCLKRFNMQGIAHIAANHSTWDLELENLSLENLLLIYIDFRVKSIRNEQNKEEAVFYSLKDSFDVILNKLDNVDEKKHHRYVHVYAKLVDFENYMISMGVNVSLEAAVVKPEQRKDPSLLNKNEIVNRYKSMAIEHNTGLMRDLGNEMVFSGILEDARSEGNWYKIRAYIQMFDEYCTYLNQRQKTQLLDFLYGMLMHREGDIRYQSAVLMGKLIVNYDMRYRKEIPADVKLVQEEVNGFTLYNTYIKQILIPNHKTQEQHKLWLGSMLDVFVEAVMSGCFEEQRRLFLNEFINVVTNSELDEYARFFVMNTFTKLPTWACDGEIAARMLFYISRNCNVRGIETHIAALRYIRQFIQDEKMLETNRAMVLSIMEAIPANETYGISLLYHEIMEILNIETNAFEFLPEAIANIYLVNLKTATPWISKLANINYLVKQIEKQGNQNILHTATHLTNMLMVSEYSIVRHRAGKALLEIHDMLTMDQLNEVAVEMVQGLELGEYQNAKYVPQYLGELILYLHPAELDEMIAQLGQLVMSPNSKVACVALDTLGIMIKNYRIFLNNHPEDREDHERRRDVIFGLIMKGLANYNDVVNQEAVYAIGNYIFGNSMLEPAEKNKAFDFMYKKIIHILDEIREDALTFYNNAACLNHIYRFILDYQIDGEGFKETAYDRIAFFPGTFDPFTLGHKEIVREIRDMGFEVFLSVDEFSWSKKTQPRLIRRKIVSMSIADEGHTYIFPDDIPVNIANPKDLERLRSLFPDNEVYIVAGSDVIENASAYKNKPVENSIHSFNHLVFLRNDKGNILRGLKGADRGIISGKIVELQLPVAMEDISSTRIRENIDYNRDISTLIDPAAQNFIYERSLYMREPQYKPILISKEISCEYIENVEASRMIQICDAVLEDRSHKPAVLKQAEKSGIHIVLLTAGKDKRPVAFSVFRHIKLATLLDEFADIDVAHRIRNAATGKALLLLGLYTVDKSEYPALRQLLLTETLAKCLSKEYIYAVYHGISEMEENTAQVREVLKLQGFIPLSDSLEDQNILFVDMRSPNMIIKNISTMLKEPLNTNHRIIEVIEKAHTRLQAAITGLYPGSLVLSMDASVMHHRMVDMITAENNVPNHILEKKCLGEKMCVPYGKILHGFVVPNTVTKSLHTEKVFGTEVDGFHVAQLPGYSPIDNQIRVIKSFNRRVILVDDLLHKGYRLSQLKPVFENDGVEIDKIIVAIMTARGKDLAEIQNLSADSPYFFPNLNAWFDELTLYPFIGGDGIEHDTISTNGLLPSINMILPYMIPHFLESVSTAAVYNYSMTCLENARDILKVLEEEYQYIFERNLTLKRLGEVILTPTLPERDMIMSYNTSVPASMHVEHEIERLIRLRHIAK